MAHPRIREEDRRHRRTLHHYDRLGLLKPRRTRHGYRVYRDVDAARLHEIAVLKSSGCRWRSQGRAVSNSRRAELLKVQRYSLGHRRQLLAVALEMIDELEHGSQHWTQLAEFVREVGGHSDPQTSWRNRRLDEARRKVFARRMASATTQSDYESNRDVRGYRARGHAGYSSRAGARRALARLNRTIHGWRCGAQGSFGDCDP